MSKDAVCCSACQLVQFAGRHCKRCGFDLPEPLSIFSALDVLPTVAEVEILLIDEALKRVKGHRQMAAQMVGVSKTSMYRKLKERA